MRELTATISEILAVIPTAEVALRQELRKNQTSALYTPPECMGERWQQVACTLALFIGTDVGKFNEWQRAILDIYNGPEIAVEQDTMIFISTAADGPGGAA
jgi:hypothetical protein